MEQRKLIRLGNSSYAIALPKEWVEKSGLKKGDNIFIEKNSNGELIVSQKFRKLNEEKEAFLNLEGKSEKEISRELISAYIKGCSVFKIKTNSDKNIEYIKEVLRGLSGVEIMEKNGHEIIAKDLMDIETVSVKGIVRRIDNSIRSMLEDIEPCIKTGHATKKQYDELFNADKDVNKFYFILWKVMLLGLENPTILNTLETDYSSLVHTWWVGMSLERTGDNIKRIARILSNKKLTEKELEKIMLLFRITKENYISVLNSYHKQDKEYSLSLAGLRDEFNDKCKQFYHGDIEHYRQICEKLQNIQNFLHYISKCVVYFIK